MEIIEYFSIENQELWLEKIKQSDWGAGQFLYELLKTHTLKDNTGQNTRVLMLVDGESLAGFCTLAEKDDIQPTELTPWIGFVYTFPAYRGQGCAGKLLKHCEELAKNDGMKAVYISTNHIGFYERYGYEFYKTMKDMAGEDSRVYKKQL